MITNEFSEILYYEIVQGFFLGAIPFMGIFSKLGKNYLRGE